jgi:hypothetical protein
VLKINSATGDVAIVARSFVRRGRARDGHGLDPSMGWVGLGWVGSHFPAHVMGWVGLNERYCDFVNCSK